MKKIPVVILISSVLTGASYSQDILVNGSFFASYMDYTSSNIKDDGYVGGIYTYVGIGLDHSFEGEIDYTKINYNGSGSLKQWDFTVLYTNHSLKNTKLKAGAHYISSDDSATDGGIVLTGGYLFYIPDSYRYGIDIAYSYYDNYALEKTYIRTVERMRGWGVLTTKTVSGLSVFQISPSAGITFPATKSAYINADVRGYYIRLSDDAGFGKNFFSIESSFEIISGNITFGLSGWIGEQEFAVKKDGFAVYNLSEKYKYGFETFIKYKTSERSFVKVGLKRDKFKELDNPSDAKITSIYAFGSITF